MTVSKACCLFLLFTISLGRCAHVSTPPTLHDQQHAENLIDQGAAFLRSGELEQAKASFRLSLELVRSAAALDGLGCVAFLRGELGNAQAYFLRAYEIDPNYQETLSNLALLYNFIGASDEAERLFKRVLQHDPTIIQSRNNFGVLLKESGNIHKAREELYKGYVFSFSEVMRENLKRVGENVWHP